MELNSLQAAAIAYIEQYAGERAGQASVILEQVREMSDISRDKFDCAMDRIKANACVALHFHPDRVNRDNLTVVASLLHDGVYKNQFDTYLSNGRLAPDPEGPRAIWESNMFGQHYKTNAVENADRPKYGSLDLMRLADGPSPRFGSCYFILDAAVSRRCTFTYLDSYQSPAEKGTLTVFEDIMASLMAECFERQYALGVKDITPDQLIERLCGRLSQPYADPSGKELYGNLDHYIEAQVHGRISLQDDVLMLAADPSFREEEVGAHIKQLCEKYGIRLFWHAGFRLDVSDVPANFRGAAMPSLARRIAREGRIDPFVIGKAARQLKLHPEEWVDRGSYEHCLQELKLLWHVLVKFGRG